MKAIVRDRYGSADVLRLSEVEVPDVGDEQVLVRVRAAGLDRGAWHIMAGLPYLLRVAGYGLRRPKVAGLGSELAGVVEAVGAKVTGLEPGEAVFGTCSASFAEYASTEPDKLARMPANLSFEQAAAVPVSGRHRTAGAARPWARQGRPARPRHRRIGRRRDLRRADRQDARSERHRRVEHAEAGPRALAGRRSRHRLHARRHHRRRQALRRRPRHRRQPAAVPTPPRPHQRRHAGHRRRRGRRSLDGRHPPPARRHGAVALRAPASGDIHRQAEQHRPRRAPSPHRGRVGHARRRPGRSRWTRSPTRSATSRADACAARSSSPTSQRADEPRSHQPAVAVLIAAAARRRAPAPPGLCRCSRGWRSGRRCTGRRP